MCTKNKHIKTAYHITQCENSLFSKVVCSLWHLVQNLAPTVPLLQSFHVCNIVLDTRYDSYLIFSLITWSKDPGGIKSTVKYQLNISKS